MRSNNPQSTLIRIHDETGIGMALAAAKRLLRTASSNSVKETEAVTILTEALYNQLLHGGGGEVEFTVEQGVFRAVINDDGEGFSSILEQAIVDGFSTRQSLGLGLASLIRISDQLFLSTSCSGTQIEIVKDLGHA